MSRQPEIEPALRAFRVGDWLAEPSLNRVSRGEISVQLEIKVMDVLVCLVDRAGELVSREKLIDTVWATEFISDNTLTHAIGELRNALGDNARNPSYIETIHRRGYRLISAIETEIADGPALASVATFPVPESRIEVEEGRNPYPGLAAFDEADAEFFFGRETEVGGMWRKLTGRRLLAVIGPSGVGKSSFLRAGVIPAMPDGWGALVCQPGEAPFASLARALVPEFTGDAEATEGLVGVADAKGAMVAVTRWRERYDQVLLIVDQFEELFTLNPPEVQDEVAAMLRRLADEAGVHVLIAMRDDFLYRCHRLAPLGPIFEGLLPLAQPSDDSLRRALAEPSARLGYCFEDDDLASEMVAEVVEARGALPLLAFAVARLWEKRDRENRSLTRQAYEDIGGVEGALARHAEATLTAIGQNRFPIVRELFRNLVTAEGTRAVRDADDLLSVFNESDREIALQVLGQLVDARLLTSFEEGIEEGPIRRHRVEVVHESLLSAWPRLVGWQTQDADSARLRDELRQAARTWGERGRHNDRLWTGAAYREFVVWRERYPGRLTQTEEDYARSMVAHETRRKRRRRLAGAASFLILLVVLVVVGVSRQQAVTEARRAEAQKLVALGGNQLEKHPTATLAWATASLEVFDTPEARRLALEALWRGPMVCVMENRLGLGNVLNMAFSPDGEYLATTVAVTNQVVVWSGSGDEPRILGQGDIPDGGVNTVGFSDALVSAGRASLRVWSRPGFKLIREFRPDDGWTMEGMTGLWVVEGRVLTGHSQEGGYLGQSWPFEGGAPAKLGRFDSDGITATDVNPEGTMLAFARGRDVMIRPIDSLVSPRHDRLVGRHSDDVTWVGFTRFGDQIIAGDKAGDTRIWSTTPDPESSLRVLRSPEVDHWFDGSGTKLVIGIDGGKRIRDIDDPPDAVRLEIREPPGSDFLRNQVHPNGRWFVANSGDRLLFWPLDGPYPYVLRGHTGHIFALAFVGDGTKLASASPEDHTLRVWPLSSMSGETGRVLWERTPVSGFSSIAADPTGRHLLVSTLYVDGGVFRVPVVEGEPIGPNIWPTEASKVLPIAFSPDGRRVAAGALAAMSDEDVVIRVWDLESKNQQVLELRDRADGGETGAYDRAVSSLHFTPEGALLSGGVGGIRLWNLESGEGRWIKRVPEDFGLWMDVSLDGRFLLTAEVLVLSANEGSNLTLHDRVGGVSLQIASHGAIINNQAIDPTGTIVVTSTGNVIRVGSADGSEPHLLFGHEGDIKTITISPDSRWIASAGDDTTIRLWPMPDISKPPLHTLPHAELIAKLKTLTNVRVVRDKESLAGWKLDVGPFPGWKTAPEW